LALRGSFQMCCVVENTVSNVGLDGGRVSKEGHVICKGR